MFVYQFVTLASWRFPLASRAGLGLQGSLVAFFAFGELYLLVGKKLNPSMLQVLPLLGMGLGMGDMFVFIRYFSQMGVEFVSTSSASEVLDLVLERAGPGVALSSICNILAFGCGSLLPVPAMSDFCIGASLLALVNFFCMMFLFTPLLVSEARRVQARLPDRLPLLFVCHRKILGHSRAANTTSIAERQSRALTVNGLDCLVSLAFDRLVDHIS